MADHGPNPRVSPEQGHDSKFLKNTAAISAVTQLASGLLVVLPGPYVLRSLPANSIADSVSRWFMVFGSLSLAAFFFVVWRNSHGVVVSRLTRIAAVAALLCLAIENVLPGASTVTNAISRARDIEGWDQLVYVVLPIVPPLSVAVFLIFLIAIWRRPVSFGSEQPSMVRKSAMLALSAMSIGIAAFLYSFVAAIHAFGAIPLAPLLLRASTLTALAVFFLAMCRNDPASANECQAAIKGPVPESFGR